MHYADLARAPTPLAATCRHIAPAAVGPLLVARCRRPRRGTLLQHGLTPCLAPFRAPSQRFCRWRTVSRVCYHWPQWHYSYASPDRPSSRWRARESHVERRLCVAFLDPSLGLSCRALIPPVQRLTLRHARALGLLPTPIPTAFRGPLFADRLPALARSTSLSPVPWWQVLFFYCSSRAHLRSCLRFLPTGITLALLSLTHPHSVKGQASSDASPLLLLSRT